MRNTGELMREAVVSGLLSSGADVLDLGIAPSPTVEYVSKMSKANGAVIITASHNPPEWNALKFVDSRGVAVSRERGEEIEVMTGKEMKPAKIGNATEYPGAIAEHTAAIVDFVDAKRIRARKLKAVLDCGNGTACLLAPYLFRKLGCEVITLNSHMDGSFPGRASEPTEANVKDCIAAVKETGADIGIAWDGDCDRVVFIDEKGRWLVGDRGFAMNARLALSKRKGKVATTVATSNVVNDVCAEFGSELVYTKVGAPYLSEAVSRDKSIVSAGEEVGGIIWPDFSLAKDGFLGAAKICEAICDKRLSELSAELPEYFNAKTKIACAPERKQKAIGEILRRAKESGWDVIAIDGVRINLQDSWVIVRASGTENYLRVFAEAKSREKAEALMRKYEKALKELVS